MAGKQFLEFSDALSAVMGIQAAASVYKTSGVNYDVSKFQNTGIPINAIIRGLYSTFPDSTNTRKEPDKYQKYQKNAP